MKFKTAETFFLAIVILFGAVIFYGSTIVRIAFDEPITPRTYGQILTGILIVVSVIRIILLQSSKSNEDKKVTITKWNLLKLAMLAMLLYSVGISSVGYFVTTFVYLLFMILILTDDRSKKAIIKYVVGTIGFVVLLWAVFDVFNIFLPNSWLM
jgi:hypothetical protein